MSDNLFFVKIEVDEVEKLLNDRLSDIGFGADRIENIKQDLLELLEIPFRCLILFPNAE
jgi:hypothetical protein